MFFSFIYLIIYEIILVPRYAKAECNQYANAMVDNDIKVNSGTASSLYYDSQKEYSNYYNHCLNEKGF